MIKYDIAGLCIQFDGDRNKYFDDRLSKYIITNSDADTDIIVNCKIKENIEPPKGKLVANINDRYWLLTDEGYASYDYNSELDICLAKVTADKKWRHIDANLYDLNQMNIDDSFAIYNMLGEVFRFAILSNNGIVIHSSSIRYNDDGIIFSAPSETGKSTHTGLWKKLYPDKVTILNDDTPAIRYINDIPYVFGTPWSGKTQINTNDNVPLKAIVFLEQSKTNMVRKLSGAEAITRLINEIRLPTINQLMQLSLNIADKLLSEIPVYLLQCNISNEAVRLIKKEIGI